MRIKAYVKNPSVIKNGGISVEFVSNYAHYLYEIYTLSAVLSTSPIKLSSSQTKFFWGISPTSAVINGCPVRIYISDGVAVWNKISFPFYPELTLPDSSEGFKLYVDV